MSYYPRSTKTQFTTNSNVQPNRSKSGLRQQVERLFTGRQYRYYEVSMAAYQTMISDLSYSTLLTIVDEHQQQDHHASEKQENGQKKRVVHDVSTVHGQ